MVLLVRFWHPDLATEEARAAALAQAALDGEAGLSARRFPPLASRRADRAVAGRAPCPACGARDEGWQLVVAAGRVTATCRCGNAIPASEPDTLDTPSELGAGRVK